MKTTPQKRDRAREYRERGPRPVRNSCSRKLAELSHNLNDTKAPTLIRAAMPEQAEIIIEVMQGGSMSVAAHRAGMHKRKLHKLINRATLLLSKELTVPNSVAKERSHVTNA